MIGLGVIGLLRYLWLEDYQLQFSASLVCGGCFTRNLTMPDLSPQRLYEVMSPVWEPDVWPELKPKGLMWLTPRRAGERGISLHEGRDLISEACWTINGDMCSGLQATDLCIARMVEGLADNEACPTLCRGVSSQISGDGKAVLCKIAECERKHTFFAHSYVEALAAACIAFKATEEVRNGE